MSQELLDLGIEPNHSVTVRAVGVRYLQGRKAESLFDTDFLKNEIVLEHAFRELLGRLGVPAGQEESVIVYVHPYDQGAADDGKSQVSRSFPIFKAFLKGLLEVVCRKEVNGDVGRAFKALKQANKMVGELRDDGEVIIYVDTMISSLTPIVSNQPSATYQPQEQGGKRKKRMSTGSASTRGKTMDSTLKEQEKAAASTLLLRDPPSGKTLYTMGDRGVEARQKELVNVFTKAAVGAVLVIRHVRGQSIRSVMDHKKRIEVFRSDENKASLAGTRERQPAVNRNNAAFAKLQQEEMPRVFVCLDEDYNIAPENAEKLAKWVEEGEKLEKEIQDYLKGKREGIAMPAHEVRLHEKEKAMNKVLKGRGLPPMAALFTKRVRLLHAVFEDCNGRNGSPGTGLTFDDAQHAYNYVGESERQASNRVYANLVEFGEVKEPTPDENAKMSKEDREQREKENKVIRATKICLGPNNSKKLDEMRSGHCFDEDSDGDGDSADCSEGTSPAKLPKRDEKKAKKEEKGEQPGKKASADKKKKKQKKHVESGSNSD